MTSSPTRRRSRTHQRPAISGPALPRASRSSGRAVAVSLLLRRLLSARRFSFTLPQLAAATLAVMLLSGGVVWMARSGDPRADFEPLSAQTTRTPAVAPAAIADTPYDAAVTDLEARTPGRTDAPRSRDRAHPRGEPRLDRSRHRPVAARARGGSGEPVPESAPRRRAAAKAVAASARQRAGYGGGIEVPGCRVPQCQVSLPKSFRRARTAALNDVEVRR